MFSNCKSLVVLAAAVGSFVVAGQTPSDQPSSDQPWKNKPVSDWTAEDAHQVLTDSPWAKTTTPTMDGPANGGGRRRSGGPGRGGGISIGGIGIGVPGIGGMGRRGGAYPGGGNSGGSNPDGTSHDGGRADSAEPPTLTLRLESALPMREAELKARIVDAPDVDENHYAIAIMGVPRNLLNTDTRSM
ncbi:MAG: hypothetical protein ACRD5L_05260, partial [Bryobacteraceae bacterium]